MKTRAVRFHSIGGPEVLRLDEVELAEPQAGELRIRVEAIGLNRAEAAYRAGVYLEQPELPSLIGYEASGVVEALGPGERRWALGDPVSVLPAFSMKRYGVCAERAIVPAAAVIAWPEGLSATQAAALWMAHLSAYGALADIARVAANDWVLITAASSSVGIAAIQIARALGALPIAVTRSAQKAAALREHGAAEVIESADMEIAARVIQITDGRGARLVFDPIAGPAVAKLADCLAVGGMLVLYGNLSGQGADTPFPFYAAVGKGLNVRGYLVFELLRDPVRLAAACRFIEAGLAEGRLSPVVDRVFGLEQIVEAHRYLEAGTQIGKVVISVP